MRDEDIIINGLLANGNFLFEEKQEIHFLKFCPLPASLPCILAHSFILW